MNTISQISIFDYTEIENLGDLEKLKLFLDNVEDNELCKIAIGALCPFSLEIITNNEIVF